MAIEKRISAAEANRNFSRLLQGARRGRTYVVTSHGQPVARLSPVEDPGAAEASGRDVLIARLRRQSVVNVGSWKREDLYEDQQ